MRILKNNAMVTKKQYDAAKKVVAEYERQNRVRPQKTFALADLDIISYSIGVPCLTEGVSAKLSPTTPSVRQGTPIE